MDDNEDQPGWVRLPQWSDEGRAARPRAARADGVRRVRRASNWTAAALIAGTAAATGYFAHHAAPATQSVSGATQVQSAGQLPAGKQAVAGPHQAAGSAPMVTSGGSGVVVGSAPGGAGAGRSTVLTWRDN